MQRTLLVLPSIGGAPLAELKHWLGITMNGEDAALERLLRAALETCEAFTGSLPLAAACEETLPARRAWQALATCPVLAITSVEGVPADGARFALPTAAYDLDIDSQGRGLIRLLSPSAAGRIAVRFEAGMASEWSALPDGLRHGVLRLAAHHYQARDRDDGPTPPAAIAALWRPWRRLRLA